MKKCYPNTYIYIYIEREREGKRERERERVRVLPINKYIFNNLLELNFLLDQTIKQIKQILLGITYNQTLQYGNGQTDI